MLLTMAAAGGSYFIGLAYEPEKIVKWAQTEEKNIPNPKCKIQYFLAL